MREEKSDREMEIGGRETDRQINSQTEKETDRKDRYTDRQADKERVGKEGKERQG